MGAALTSSVAEHRFGSSEPYTVGTEEEYMLLDPATLELVQRADTVLEADGEGEFAARTSCELFQSEIEGQTPICSSIDDAHRERRRVRRRADVLLRPLLVRLRTAGHDTPGVAVALYEDLHGYRVRHGPVLSA